jgi:small subunit ribosomal protein S7
MRHKKVVKRKTEEDKVYRSKLVAKFINRIMHDGKKSVAEKVFYDCFALLEKDGGNALSIFETAINNIGPKVEVKSKRVGGVIKSQWK